MPRRTIEREVDAGGSRAPHRRAGDNAGAVRPHRRGSGIVFRRTDLPDQPWIPARLDEVEATERRTAMRAGRRDWSTPWSTCSRRLGALEIDDLMVELDGPEPPILDGTFRPWIDVTQRRRATGTGGRAGRLPGRRTPFHCHRGRRRATSCAGQRTPRSTVTIEWPHPLIGRQTGSYDIDAESFRRELAPARGPSGSLHEVEALQAQGPAQGRPTGKRGRAGRTAR